MTHDLALSLNDLCYWLERTTLNHEIQTIAWIVPAVQTIHILSFAVVIGAALAIDLRLLGVLAADQPIKRVLQRFMPFIWAPLLVLLMSGAIMIAGEPARSLNNPALHLKLGLVLAATMVTATCHLLVRRCWSDELATNRSRIAVVIAVFSMLLWVGIIFAGRWIAYV